MPLVELLQRALPYIPAALITILAAWFYLTGMAGQVGELLQQIQYGTAQLRSQALADFRAVLQPLFANPGVRASAAAQGLSITNVQAQVNTAIDSAIVSTLPAAAQIPLPRFASLPELTTWWSRLSGDLAAGRITSQQFDVVLAHVRAETLRLEGVAPAPIPSPFPEVAPGPTIVPAPIAIPRPVAVAPPITVPAVTPITVVVPAPVVNVYPQPVVVPVPNILVNVPPAAAAINNVVVNVPPMVIPAPVVNNLIDFLPLVGAMATVGVGAVTSIIARGGDLAHNMTAGRVKCQVTTGAGIFNNLIQAAAPLALSVALDKFGPFRDFLTNIFTRLWDEVLDDPALNAPVLPEGTPALSKTFFIKALQAGQSAHLMAVAAESFSPLKYLGLGQMAAFLGDMAGFGKIGGAMMGAVETATLAKPMGYLINQRTRPVIPGLLELKSLAAEYAMVPRSQLESYLRPGGDLTGLESLNRAEFHKWGAYSGYSEEWLDKMGSTIHRPASRFVMRDIVDQGIWDESYFRRELASSGYNVETIGYSLSSLRRFAVKDEVSYLQSESTFDFLDGFVDEAQYRADLAALGLQPVAIEARVQGALSRRSRTWQKQRMGYLVTAAVGRRISIEDLSDELTRMGLVEERRLNALEEVQLRRQVERPPAAVTSEERALAAELEQHVINELLSSGEYRQQLTVIGFATTETDTRVRTAELKLARKQAGKLAREESVILAP